MTEDEARASCAAIAGSRMSLLEQYVKALLEENARQNLIARSTEATVWRRHILDALQLATFAREDDRTWLDVGSGPGLPGVPLAILDRWQLTLVEPRRRRAEFLRMVSQKIGVSIDIVQADIQRVSNRHDLVTARAVTSIDRLFEITRACFDPTTRFVLPKGQSARTDVDAARSRWHGTFHVEQSLTDPDAGIVVIDRVTSR